MTGTLLKKWAITGLFFFIFRLFNIVDSQYINVQFNILLITGFEPWTSGVGSDRSTN